MIKFSFRGVATNQAPLFDLAGFRLRVLKKVKERVVLCWGGFVGGVIMIIIDKVKCI